jgi:hypothetical protein
VWFGFVMMLTFCTILRQKFFVKRASLREKRDACNLSSLFFHCKKAHQTKVLSLGTTKIVSISKRQATKQEKSQDAATFMESIEIQYTPVKLRPVLYVPEESAEFYAQEAAGCHQEGG